MEVGARYRTIPAIYKIHEIIQGLIMSFQFKMNLKKKQIDKWLGKQAAFNIWDTLDQSSSGFIQSGIIKAVVSISGSSSPENLSNWCHSNEPFFLSALRCRLSLLEGSGGVIRVDVSLPRVIIFTLLHMLISLLPRRGDRQIYHCRGLPRPYGEGAPWQMIK